MRRVFLLPGLFGITAAFLKTETPRLLLRLDRGARLA
jgi:hypothetical protein